MAGDITDVVNQYDWTSVPRGSKLRAKAPFVDLETFRIKSNTLNQFYNTFLAIINQTSASDYYDKLYRESVQKEHNYRLPFFTDEIRSFGNEFGESWQDGSGGVASGGLEATRRDLVTTLGKVAVGSTIFGTAAIGKASSQAMDAYTRGDFGGIKDALGTLVAGYKSGGDPGAFVETPKFYQFNDESDAPLPVSFVLSNTINEDAIKKNYDLVKELTKINRPFRKNGLAVDPPRIYSVKVPGFRYMKWAYCSDFGVEFLGTRKFDKGSGALIPEGYKINMTFKSLTLEHSGFMDETLIQ